MKAVGRAEELREKMNEAGWKIELGQTAERHPRDAVIDKIKSAPWHRHT